MATTVAPSENIEELKEKYADLVVKLEKLIPCMEVPFHLPWIDKINQLKKERNAVIMAHSYQTPEIFHGVADIAGDSLGIAQAAAEVDSDLIVMCGVHFMAESAKLIAPEKTVLIPDLEAGCSLASSITAADVEELRRQHPGAPVVCYANTSAAVKAASDACCTSANAARVVEAMGSDKVIFVPDNYLGNWVQGQTDVELVLWHGTCEVHDKFTAAEAKHTRETFGVKIAAHPECSPEVLAEADFVGSTSAMGRWLEKEKPERVAMVTECSMADNMRTDFPDIEFIKPCNLCPHMKRITLPKIYESLKYNRHEILIPDDVVAGAQASLDRMLEIGRAETV